MGMKTGLAVNSESQFSFLTVLALKLGASETKIIPANEVIIENRVVLKCRVGCKHYGKTLMCPPYAPSVEEFKKIITEYSHVLLFKFKSKAELTHDVAKLLSKNDNDPSLTKEMREKIRLFWASWKQEKLRLLEMVRDLERAAMNKGYRLAVGFTTGSCMVCEDCNIEQKTCRQPSKARYTAQSVGVNVEQTLENAGIPIPFPMKDAPETFGMVLID
jgi:predicted metal-binding protein